MAWGRIFSWNIFEMLAVMPEGWSRRWMSSICKSASGVLQSYLIETGVLHQVGLRNTLEPDPDNTGVGSFGSEAVFLFESWREFSCFIQ
jgi:hypothetical protein